MPVAVNCWVEPARRLAGEAGVTAIEDNFDKGITTSRITGEFVIPDMVAVIFAVPTVTPATIPV